jgi:DNA-binding GntR family transcriptional regulator
MLRETELAERFDVSRGTVQALLVLAREGVVAPVAGRVWFPA